MAVSWRRRIEQVRFFYLLLVIEVHLCVVLIFNYSCFTVSGIQIQALALKEFAQNIDFEHIKKRVLLYYVYYVPSLAAWTM
jgi:hypothetical protein